MVIACVGESLSEWSWASFMIAEYRARSTRSLHSGFHDSSHTDENDFTCP